MPHKILFTPMAIAILFHLQQKWLRHFTNIGMQGVQEIGALMELLTVTIWLI